MKRYLVTGAQGFVGRFVVAHLLRNGSADILGIGRSECIRDSFTHSVCWNGESIRAPLPDVIRAPTRSDRYAYEAVDLQDHEAIQRILTGFQPNYVIHLASGLFGDCFQSLFRCNVEGTINLLDAIPTHSGIERVVLGSSGGVYGQADQLPISESVSPKPIHMYSVSKYASELAAKIKATERAIPLVIARIFNIVGPGQDERHACGRWMQQLASIRERLQSLREKPELKVGRLDATRDMIDVRDTALACIHLCHYGVAGETYNVATGIESAMRDVMDECLAATGMSGQVTIREFHERPVDIRRHFADIGKLRSTGWTPTVSLSESIGDLFRYYVETVPAYASSKSAGKVRVGG